VVTFKTNYTTLLTRLKATNAEMLVMTIPDPFDTPFFTPLPGVTRLVGTPQSSVMSIFGVKQDDMLTPYGLMLVGNLILSKNVAASNNPLYPGLSSFLPGTVATAATRTAGPPRVAAL